MGIYIGIYLLSAQSPYYQHEMTQGANRKKHFPQRDSAYELYMMVHLYIIFCAAAMGRNGGIRYNTVTVEKQSESYLF